MTLSQASYILRLIEERRVSRATAEKVIDLLLQHPPLSESGLEKLIEIIRPQ